jgi:G3E family GTPase
MSTAIPVNVITGFLGSGKTTLLRHILSDGDYADCAILINEFGEVGIDHLIIERVDGETVVMQSGCICCTLRDDLAGAIRSLHERREAGALPPFRRLIIETTGLADPTPILATVMNDPVIRHHFRLGNIVTTVDGVNGEGHLDRQPESMKQVALADRLLVTKGDIAEPQAIHRLDQRLARLNPAALRFHTANSAVAAGLLIGEDVFEPASKSAEVSRWLRTEAGHDHAADAGHDAHHHHGGSDASRHDAHIRAFTMTFDRTVDWTVFGVWLTMLLHAHGEDVLRVKGILNVGEGAAPVVINGVQHLVHAPLHLDRWPDDDRRSRLVFIVRDIAEESITESFAVFHRALAAKAVAA